MRTPEGQKDALDQLRLVQLERELAWREQQPDEKPPTPVRAFSNSYETSHFLEFQNVRIFTPVGMPSQLRSRVSL